MKDTTTTHMTAEVLDVAAQGRKVVAVLAAAEEAFLRLGYAATSMDFVAEQARVSKRTVYNYYASKQKLFEAVVSRRCTDAAPQFLTEDQLNTATPEKLLEELSSLYLKETFSPVYIALFRTVVAEAPNFPELARVMLEGPIGRPKAIFASFLKRQMKLGRVRCADPEMAATQLLAMLKADLESRLLFASYVSTDPVELDLVASRCVHTFLHGVMTNCD